MGLIESQFQQVLKTKWRPSYTKMTRDYEDSRKKSWKAYGKGDKHNPVFEAKMGKPGWLNSHSHCVEVTKWGMSMGTTWTLSLEAIDKLIIMLLVARAKLVKEMR